MPRVKLTEEQKRQSRIDKAYGEALRRIRDRVPTSESDESFDAIAQAVIYACEGMGFAAWIELDERGGYRDLPGRFCWVRQTRNSPKWGPALMRAVNQKVQGRTYAG